MRRNRPVALLALLSVFFGYALILKRLPYEFLLLFVILFALEIGIFYIKYTKTKLLQEHSIWIEDGILKCHAASSYHEAPCCQISRIIESKRLLMLGISKQRFKLPGSLFLRGYFPVQKNSTILCRL